MTYKLFLDDARYPEDVKFFYPNYYADFIICRNMKDAQWIINHSGIPYFISFDHDLEPDHYIAGEGSNTGYDFAKWFCNHIMDHELVLPDNFDFFTHSMNPVGKKNIEVYMDNFLKQWYGND